MSEVVQPRDLRNHYGDLLRRVQAGETLDIVRDGVPVASLTPPRRPLGTSRARVHEIYAGADPIDRAGFFADVDEGLDPEVADPYER